MFKKDVIRTTALCFGVLSLIFSLNYFALAWNEPTVSAPGNNVFAPINVGGITQTKTGGFQVNGIFYARGLFNADGGGTPGNGLNVINNGNVGIGVVNPVNKLDVNGKIQAVGDVCTSINGNCLSTIGGAAGASKWTTVGSNIYNNNYLTGNVGIGINNPLHKLHVGGKIQAVGDVCTSINGNCLSTIGGAGSNNWTLSGSSLYPNSTSYNVGIGKTTAGYKLDVAGQIYVNNNRILGVATPIAGTDAVNKDYVDGLISAASGGGSCYYNYGGMTCAAGWTPVLVGYTTIYWSNYISAPAGGVECSSVTHSSLNGGYEFFGISSYGHPSQINNERCAICCK